MNSPEGVSGPEQGAAGGPTTEQVAAALGAVWNEICADNGCFPDCINVEQEPELTLYADFRRGEFARLVAETLRAALRSAPPTGQICPTHGKAVLMTHVDDSEPCSDFLRAPRG